MAHDHSAAQKRYADRQKAQDPKKWRDKRRQVNNEWNARNPEKRAAHWQVYATLKKGILVRPDSCARCSKKCRPEASHDDYSKPLEVEWLCRRCHARKDAKIRREA